MSGPSNPSPDPEFAEVQAVYRDVLAHDGDDHADFDHDGFHEAVAAWAIKEAERCEEMLRVLEGDALASKVRSRKTALLVMVGASEFLSANPDSTDEQVEEFEDELRATIEAER